MSAKVVRLKRLQRRGCERSRLSQIENGAAKSAHAYPFHRSADASQKEPIVRACLPSREADRDVEDLFNEALGCERPL
jgi:hypothetical protein